MNVFQNNFFIINILLLISIFTFNVYSAEIFNACGISYEEPYFAINDSSGIETLLIDNNGNLFAYGESKIATNKDSFIVGDNVFNNESSVYDYIFQNVSSMPFDSGLIIRSNSGNDVAKITNNSIYLKGKGAIEREQANCLMDGGYCVGDILETRDYYCDINGERSGACLYDLVSSENCLNKISYENDSGKEYFKKGYVLDFLGCNSNNCTYDKYDDYCLSSTDLVEYYEDGVNYGEETYSCSVNDYNYCDGNTWRKVTYNCGSGECYEKSDLAIQDCTFAPPTDYSAWSCLDNKHKTRVETNYAPICTISGCSYSSSQVTETIACQGEKICVSGNCVDPIFRSCKELLEAGKSTGDGVYYIDPDGVGGNPEFQVYCEMSTGGWTVLVGNSLYSSGNFPFNPSLVGVSKSYPGGRYYAFQGGGANGYCHVPTPYYSVNIRMPHNEISYSVRMRHHNVYYMHGGYVDIHNDGSPERRIWTCSGACGQGQVKDYTVTKTYSSATTATNSRVYFKGHACQNWGSAEGRLYLYYLKVR